MAKWISFINSHNQLYYISLSLERVEWLFHASALSWGRFWARSGVHNIASTCLLTSPHTFCDSAADDSYDFYELLKPRIMGKRSQATKEEWKNEETRQGRRESLRWFETFETEEVNGRLKISTWLACKEKQKMQKNAKNATTGKLQTWKFANFDKSTIRWTWTNHEQIHKKWLWANIMIFHFISKRPFRWCTLTIAFIVVVWYWRPNGSTGLRSRLLGGLYRRSSYSPTPPGGGATGALMWHKTSPFLSLLSSFCLFRARRNLRPFFCWKNTPSKHSFTKTTNLLDKETL